MLPLQPHLGCLSTATHCVPCAGCQCKRVITSAELTARSLRLQGNDACLTRRHFSPNGYVSRRPARSGGGASRRVARPPQGCDPLPLHRVRERQAFNLTDEGDLHDEVVLVSSGGVLKGVLLALCRPACRWRANLDPMGLLHSSLLIVPPAELMQAIPKLLAAIPVAGQRIGEEELHQQPYYGPLAERWVKGFGMGWECPSVSSRLKSCTVHSHL